MLKICPLVDDLKPPSKAHEGDSGWDVYSREDIEIMPHGRHSFALGFAILGERGKMYLVQAKSGLALRGITTIGNVIDNQYRGEVHALILNSAFASCYIKKGDKIAQIVIVNDDDDSILEFGKIEETSRGDGGFGSTGI